MSDQPDNSPENQELEKLREDNKRLSEQVKQLIKTESELYEFQEQLDSQVRIYRKFYELGKTFNNTTDVDEILEHTLEFVLYELNFERCLVLIRNEENGSYDLYKFDGYYDEELEAQIAGFSMSFDSPLIKPVLEKEQEQVLFREVDQGEDESQIAERLDLCEFILTPMGGDRREPFSMMIIGNSEEQAVYQTRITDDSEWMLSLGNLVSQSSTAINNAQFYKALEKERNSLERKVESRTRELSEANENLKKLDEMKTQFFANVSHELRTPLTLSIGPLETILNDDSLPDHLRSHLETVYNNQLRLLKLINELLDFAKLEAGRMDAAFRKENVNEIVKYYIGTLDSAAQSRNLTLDLDLPEHITELYLDRNKFEKIVMNLLSNAFKFTPDEGRIGLKVEPVEKPETGEPESVKIHISDTGIGISEEQQAKIFDRFSQADSSDKRSYSGTGIGLAMVKEYVEMHGGSISVASEPGKGSTFTMQFKAGRDHLDPDKVEEEITGEVDDLKAYQLLEFESEEDEELTAEEIEELPQHENSTPDNELNVWGENGEELPDEFKEKIEEGENEQTRVLVVDDTSDMRRFLKDLLQKEYKVFLARDGLEGLEKARKINPDIIISDVMMPRMSGYELCSKIKNSEGALSHTPVILLTAKADTSMKIEGLEKGADDYLVKPFNADELLTRANNLVNLRKQEQRLYLAYSEIKEKNEQLNDTLDQLKQMQDELVVKEKLASLGSLTAGIAHEIRNPLNFINNFSDSAAEMMDEVLEEIQESRNDIGNETADYITEITNDVKLNLGKINEHGSRANNIVNNMLLHSRGESGERTSTDLNELISEYLNLSYHGMRAQDKSFNVEINTDLDDSVPRMMLVHQNIGRVLLNIFNNAFYATNEKKSYANQGYQPEVIASSRKKSQGEVEIRIRDNGNGIPEEKLDSIFTPFFTTKPTGEGTGLGLSISYDIIVHEHHGDIKVDSSQGEYTEFIITLPVISESSTG